MTWVVGSREPDPNVDSWKVEWQEIKKEIQVIFKKYQSKPLLKPQEQQDRFGLNKESSQEN